MRPAIAVLLAVALQGCSSENADAAASQETAAPPADKGLVAVTEAPPLDVDVLELEPLGDVAGVDLGARDGSCTFLNRGGDALMLAGAPDDANASGKAVIRAGGVLYLLTAARGGLAEVRGGTLFTGAGFTVRVSPPRPKDSKTLIAINTAKGGIYLPGEWNCT